MYFKIVQKAYIRSAQQDFIIPLPHELFDLICRTMNHTQHFHGSNNYNLTPENNQPSSWNQFKNLQLNTIT